MSTMWGCLVVLGIAIAMVACGGDGDGLVDAFPTPPAIPWLDEGRPEVAAPDVPWLGAGEPRVDPPDTKSWGPDGSPVSWVCPGSWLIRTEDGLSTCEPYDDGQPETCPVGRAHFPDRDDCEPVGSACGEGPFPTIDDAEEHARLVFVRAGAIGGDGSRESPHGALAAGLDDASRGTLVVLAAGTYRVDRSWPAGVSARGLCAEETVVVADPDLKGRAVVTVDTGSASFSDLRIGPADISGVFAMGDEASVTLRGVVLDRVTGAGLLVDGGADATVERAVIQETEWTPDETVSVAVQVSDRGTLTGRQLLLVNNALGVAVFRAGASATLDDVAVLGAPDAWETTAYGVAVDGGGTLTANRLVVDDVKDVGLVVRGGASRATLRDVVVRGTRALEDGTGGYGVSVLSGAAIEADGILVEECRDTGVRVGIDGASAVLRNAVIRRTKGRPADGAFGMGLTASADGEVQLRQAVLTENRDAAIVALDAGTRVVLEDVKLAGTLTGPTGAGGYGLYVEGPAVDARRLVLEGNRRSAAVLFGSTTTATFSDVVIRGTRGAGVDGRGGVGVTVDLGARLDMERALVEDNQRFGLLLTGEGSRADVRHLRLADTRPTVEGFAGIGVIALDGVQVHGQRWVVEGNSLSGISAFLEGTNVDLSDVVVRDTEPQEVDGIGGVGLIVEGGASLSASRLLVARARELGVSVAARGSVRLTDAVIADTAPREPSGIYGGGLGLDAGSSGLLERVVIERTRDRALIAWGEGTTLDAQDLTLRDTLGRGIEAFFNPTLSVQRMVVERSEGVGVLLGDGATVALVDALVAETRGGDLGTGDGVGVQGGASLSAERLIVEGNESSGLYVLDANASIRDVVVRDTESEEPSLVSGAGVTVGDGAVLDLERARLERNLMAGLHVYGVRSSASVRDVAVSNTGPPECAPSCEVFAAYGAGLAAYLDGRLEAERFVVEGSDFCGLLVAEGGNATFDQGLVSRNPVAVCLFDTDLDLAELPDRVSFVENEQPLEVGDFPLPTPTSPLDSGPGPP